MWTADSLTAIAPHAAPGTATTAVLAAARGETESFQIVVTGRSQALHDVDLSVAPLAGPGGATIPRESIVLFREQFVDVPPAMPVAGTDGPGEYADGLVPFADPETGAPLDGAIRARDITVEPGRNQPYWVDVEVPRDAAPGVYRGAFSVTSAGGAATGTVELTVLDLTLPATPTLSGAFVSSSGRSAIDRELVRHGLMPGTPLESLDRSLITGREVNSVNAGFFGGADRDTCELEPPPDAAEVTAAAGQAPAGALVYNYTADEINDCAEPGLLYPALREWARTLHEAGVEQLVTMPPDPELFDDGTGAPVVDVWAVLPMDHDPAMLARASALGMRMWSYTALSQDSYSPKWLIGADPLAFRAMPGFLNQGLGYTGLLYWRVDNWGDDPWHTAVMYDGRYPGDGMLVYPGEDVGLPGGAAPSIRLKWLRDGVEDYDYAELARAVAGDAAVDAVVRSVAPDWRGWTKDPAALRSARAALADLATGGGQG